MAAGSYGAFAGMVDKKTTQRASSGWMLNADPEALSEVERTLGAAHQVAWLAKIALRGDVPTHDQAERAGIERRMRLIRSKSRISMGAPQLWQPRHKVCRFAVRFRAPGEGRWTN